MLTKNSLTPINDLIRPTGYQVIPNALSLLIPYYIWETLSHNWVLLNIYRQPPGIPGDPLGKPTDENHSGAVIMKPIDMDRWVDYYSYNDKYGYWSPDNVITWSHLPSNLSPKSVTDNGVYKLIPLLSSLFDIFNGSVSGGYVDKAWKLQNHGLVYPDGSDADPFCLHFGDSLTFDIHDLYALVDGGNA